MNMTDATTAELVEALREDAEWCDANEYEIPITMGDHIRAAADRLEMMEAAMGCDKRQVLLLPCKIGDPIWWVVTRHEYPHKGGGNYLLRSKLYWHNLERVLKEYGKTVFTIKEEAMAAMEGAKADG